MKKSRYLIILIITSLIPGLAFAGELDKIVEKIEKRYSNTSYKADFFQESTLKALDIRQSAGGFVIFSHPGKMYWEYNFPEKQEIVTDGETIWIYKHNNSQVTTGKSKDYFKEGMGGSFLSNIKSIKKNFDLSEGEPENSNTFSLMLYPLKKGPVLKIEVMVLKESGKIIYVKTTNNNNDDTILRFKKEEFLDNLNDEIFRFKVPENANITNISQ